MKKKVCIIGCGNIANVHAQVLTPTVVNYKKS